MRTYSNTWHHASNPKLLQKKVILTRLLREQIHIASKLQRIEGPKSKDTICAWDVVEELSDKVEKLRRQIEYDKIAYDNDDSPN